MNKSIQKLALILGIALSFVSCKKDTDDTMVVGATDYTLAEALYSDIFRMADAAMKSEPGVYRGGSFSVLSNCSSTTLNPGLPDMTFPKTLTIDFGLINCTGTDGRKRRGKISANISNSYGNVGTKASLSFVNLAINDHKITGTASITFNGSSYTFSVQNGGILTPGGESISYQSVSTREWANGSGTPQDPDDDIFLISGSSTGKGRQGISFTTSVKSPMRSEPFCRSLVSGNTEIVINNKNNAFIDYGSGACDDEAIMTFDKRTFFLRLQ